MRDSEKAKQSSIGELFMPQEQKLSTEEKVKLVRQCISGEISIQGYKCQYKNTHKWKIKMYISQV
jgi:hypothetical protein